MAISIQVAEQLGSEYAKWVTGTVNLVEKQDEIAIAHFEAFLQLQNNPDSSWVRELVTAARDPATGQAYLDRRIPEIVASVPDEYTYVTWQRLAMWYLYFGFFDRYFELILDLDLTDTTWSDADYIVYLGTAYRRLGFTAHPRYLEVAERMGLINVWEQRGPPDFCEKIDGQWVCE